MPLVPVVQLVIDDAFVKVPDAAVFLVHNVVQSVAEISVARHLIEFRLPQASNILQ